MDVTNVVRVLSPVVNYETVETVQLIQSSHRLTPAALTFAAGLFKDVLKLSKMTTSTHLSRFPFILTMW